MTIIRSAFVVTLLMLSAILTACDNNSASVVDKVSSSGQIKEILVGSDAAFSPFEFLNENGDIVGFDVDILTAAAAKTGLKVNFINTPWEKLFSLLQNGDCDILASAITITDERQKNMDFSDPYFNIRQLIVVPEGATDIRTLDDLKGKKIAVQIGTTSAEAVQKILGKTNPSIKYFGSMPLVMQELINGGVHAIVGDSAMVVDYIKTHPNNHITQVEDSLSFDIEYYGFAVRKDDKELLDNINEGLKTIKSDGTYELIYKKYFGESARV